MIVIFRGKAATGKSSLATMINKKHGYHVLSKDAIFDELLAQGNSWNDANEIAYNNLSEKIQKSHDCNENIIVDIGLAHTPSYVEFLSKMTLDKMNVQKFLFICSDDEIWAHRISKRINNPIALNQAFKSVEEAMKHYCHYEIMPLENESVIDSALTFEIMLDIFENKLDSN